MSFNVSEHRPWDDSSKRKGNNIDMFDPRSISEILIDLFSSELSQFAETVVGSLSFSNFFYGMKMGEPEKQTKIALNFRKIELASFESMD